MIFWYKKQKFFRPSGFELSVSSIKIIFETLVSRSSPDLKSILKMPGLEPGTFRLRMLSECAYHLRYIPVDPSEHTLYIGARTWRASPAYTLKNVVSSFLKFYIFQNFSLLSILHKTIVMARHEIDRLISLFTTKNNDMIILTLLSRTMYSQIVYRQVISWSVRFHVNSVSLLSIISSNKHMNI